MNSTHLHPMLNAIYSNPGRLWHYTDIRSEQILPAHSNAMVHSNVLEHSAIYIFYIFFNLWQKLHKSGCSNWQLAPARYIFTRHHKHFQSEAHHIIDKKKGPLNLETALRKLVVCSSSQFEVSTCLAGFFSSMLSPTGCNPRYGQLRQLYSTQLNWLQSNSTPR